MLVMQATLPLGFTHQVALAQALALAVSLALTAALATALWAATALTASPALAIGVSLIPVVLFGWGIGSIVASQDTTRVQGLLGSVGLALALVLTTRYMLGWIIDRLGLSLLATLNPLQPVHETLIQAATGWGGGIEPVPTVLGLALAAISVPLARRTGVPR